MAFELILVSLQLFLLVSARRGANFFATFGFLERGTCAAATTAPESFRCIASSAVCCSPHLCVGFLFLVLHPVRLLSASCPPPPPPASSPYLLTHNLHTHKLLTHNLFTHNLFTHNLFTHNLSTHNLLTHNLLTDNLLTDNLLTYNLLTHNLHTHNLLTHNLFTHNLSTHNLHTHTLDKNGSLYDPAGTES